MGTKKSAKKEIESVIDQAANLDAELKAIEKLLKPLKEEIKVYAKGCYTDDEIAAGVTISGTTGAVKVSASEKRADPNPQKVFKMMVDKGIGDKFPDVVKVQITALKKFSGVFTDTELNKLRPFESWVIKQNFSFKG